MCYDQAMKEMATLRMDADLKATITQLAAAEDRSFAWLCEKLLTEALAARGVSAESGGSPKTRDAQGA